MGRLIKTIDLTVSRDSGSGVWNADGTYTEGGRSDIVIKANVQPFRKGDSQQTLPEGLRAEDAVFVYTQTPVQTVNQFNETKADKTILDSVTYTALNSENWARNGLRLDHYKVLFVRDDKLTNGGL